MDVAINREHRITLEDCIRMHEDGIDITFDADRQEIVATKE